MGAHGGIIALTLGLVVFAWAAYTGNGQWRGVLGICGLLFVAFGVAFLGRAR